MNDNPFSKVAQNKNDGPFTHPVNQEEHKKKNKFSIWIMLGGLFLTAIAFTVILVFVLAWGGPNNPVLDAWGIDPYSLKESLMSLTRYAFLLISSVLLILLTVGIFQGLMAKKEDLVKKRNSLILSVFSFGMLFFTVIVWISLYSYIDRFVVNAEPPSANIEFTPSQDEIMGMEAPVEILISSADIKKKWERKGKKVSSFAWDLNNDNVFEFRTNEIEFLQEFNLSGEITVKLMVLLDDGSQDIVERKITLPSSVFYYSPKSGEAPLLVEFDASKLNNPRNPIAEYAWDFDGDKEFDELINRAKTSHRFMKIGKYQVTLRTSSQTGKLEYYTAEVNVQGGVDSAEEIQAVINVSPTTTGLAPLKLLFSGADSISPNGNIVSYEWDFGEGNLPEKIKDVNYTYKKPGEYEVSLRVTDSAGDTAEISEKIIVEAEVKAPVAKITYSPKTLSGKVPFTLEFDASMSEDLDNNIVSYEWDLDGDFKTDVQKEKFEHTFLEAGEHKVTLRVVDADLQESSTSVTVVTEETDLVAVLKASPESGSVPLTVDFDASSSSYANGKIVSYQWDFGDESIPQHAGATKAHRFSKIGEYEVRVTVFTDDDKSATTTKKIYVRVPATQACFKVSRNTVNFSGNRDRDIVSFDSLCSQGNISQWKWDFGDGSISRDRNPSYAYEKPGNYTVNLEIIDNNNNVSSYSDVIEVR